MKEKFSRIAAFFITHVRRCFFSTEVNVVKIVFKSQNSNYKRSVYINGKLSFTDFVDDRQNVPNDNLRSFEKWLVKIEKLSNCQKV